MDHHKLHGLFAVSCAFTLSSHFVRAWQFYFSFKEKPSHSHYKIKLMTFYSVIFLVVPIFKKAALVQFVVALVSLTTMFGRINEFMIFNEIKYDCK